LEGNLLKSPLNYTGGKYKLLPQLLPLFPSSIDVLVDLFAGGLDISINVQANAKICNDREWHIMDLYQNLQNLSGEEVHNRIMQLVTEYALSKENQDGYIKLRSDYNQAKSWDKFYALIAHSFCHQIRFNKKGDFNISFGKARSCYNNELQGRLQAFTDIINDSYTFLCKDFRQVDLSALSDTSFVYCDPPYRITTAGYNENNGWIEQDDKDLLALLDALNDRGIKFGLSNVLSHGERENTLLIEWSKKYIVHRLNFGYANSSYHKKKENKVNTQEVYICNYLSV